MGQIPVIQWGWMPVEPGIFEHIHPNRMRIPPRVKMHGPHERYRFRVLENNEIFTRLAVEDRASGEVVSYPVPLKLPL